MPSSNDRLRKKFFTYNSEGRIVGDGIGKAEATIERYGGKILPRGTIIMPKLLPGRDSDMTEFSDAIDWLCLEWDYDTTTQEEIDFMEGRNPNE